MDMRVVSLCVNGHLHVCRYMCVCVQECMRRPKADVGSLPQLLTLFMEQGISVEFRACWYGCELVLGIPCFHLPRARVIRMSPDTPDIHMCSGDSDSDPHICVANNHWVMSPTQCFSSQGLNAFSSCVLKYYSNNNKNVHTFYSHCVCWGLCRKKRQRSCTRWWEVSYYSTLAYNSHPRPQSSHHGLGLTGESDLVLCSFFLCLSSWIHITHWLLTNLSEIDYSLIHLMNAFCVSGIQWREEHWSLF